MFNFSQKYVTNTFANIVYTVIAVLLLNQKFVSLNKV